MIDLSNFEDQAVQPCPAVIDGFTAPHVTDLPAVKRVWAMSDVHTDAPENLRFLERIDEREHQNDVLILAGDVSDSGTIMRQTLRLLKSRFAHVFFVPGNHDLWLTSRPNDDWPKFDDSFGKLDHIRRVCREEGVETLPRRLRVENVADGNRGHVEYLWIVPLLSWHCQAFDTEPNIDPRWGGVEEVEEVCTDYFMCRWPPGLDSKGGSDVAERFDAMNDDVVQALPEDERGELKDLFAGRRSANINAVISFSHFLPRIELIPEKRFLFVPNLTKIVGSPMLGHRVDRLRPDVHVFGHTHFGWDEVLDGVRYISPPVGMPRERGFRLPTIACGDFPQTKVTDAPAKPLLLWDACSGIAPHYEAFWPEFYRKNERTPWQVTVLPKYNANRFTWDESMDGPKPAMIERIPIGSFGPAWARTK
eukprot:TRINITY_DN5669_c0_g1_i1.p1 TRINITY_DN5669_c0_g1~~TRINITY_DN5669_c0_g1_i1.p1  ORF type:complete len:420 (+),score=50.89 TRINITY_DN5669_c0_g1_i1:127-1386(+)